MSTACCFPQERTGSFEVSIQDMSDTKWEVSSGTGSRSEIAFGTEGALDLCPIQGGPSEIHMMRPRERRCR